jgi:hypothetical protein
MHSPQELGIDDFQANRSPTMMYRTSPLKGLFSHVKGGFYHDGRFATLQAVVDHYDSLQYGAHRHGQKQSDCIPDDALICAPLVTLGLLVRRRFEQAQGRIARAAGFSINCRQRNKSDLKSLFFGLLPVIGFEARLIAAIVPAVEWAETCQLQIECLSSQERKEAALKVRRKRTGSGRNRNWQAGRKHERFVVSNDASAKIVARIAVDASRR